MKRLTRREWEYLEIGEGEDRVSRAEADALLRLADRAAPELKLAGNGAEGLNGGEKVILDGRHRLRMQQVVGVLSTAGVTLEILPKTEAETPECRRDLIAMLAMAGEATLATMPSARLEEQSDDLLEVVIAAFARDLLAALRPGIPHVYAAREDDLGVMRGRLDLRRQYGTLAGRADRLACRFDELLPDTPLNRILRAAALLLARHTRRQATARLLCEALALLEGVAPLPPGPLPAVHFNRMTTRFRTLHDRACQFLRGRFQSTTSGTRDGIALLFRMNDLFEAWVGAILHRGLPAQGWNVHLQAKGQVRHALRRADRPLFAMFPDILLQRDGRHIVLDTKWKRLAAVDQDPRRKVSQADVYQLLAYRQAWGAEELVLIYPGSGTSCRIDRLVVQGPEVPFVLMEVPLIKPRTAAKTILEAVRGTIPPKFGCAPVPMRQDDQLALPPHNTVPAALLVNMSPARM